MAVLRFSGPRRTEPRSGRGSFGGVYAYKQLAGITHLLAEATIAHQAQAAVYTYKQIQGSQQHAGCLRPVYTYKQPQWHRPAGALHQCGQPAPMPVDSVDTHELQPWTLVRTALRSKGSAVEIHAYRQQTPPGPSHGPRRAAKTQKPAGHACTWRRVYAYKQLQSCEPVFSTGCAFSGSGVSTTATVSSRFSSAVANARRLSSGTAIDTSKTSPRCL